MVVMVVVVVVMVVLLTVVVHPAGRGLRQAGRAGRQGRCELLQRASICGTAPVKCTATRRCVRHKNSGFLTSPAKAHLLALAAAAQQGIAAAVCRRPCHEAMLGCAVRLAGCCHAVPVS